MSQNISNRRQQRRPENKINSTNNVFTVPQDVSFNSSSEIVEWDRELYDLKRESIRQNDQQHNEQKLKFASNLSVSDGSDASLYKRCQKRADIHVKQVIAEQDAASKYDIPQNVGIRNFIRKIDPETFTNEKPQNSKLKDPTAKINDEPGPEQQQSSRKEQSDTEISQVTQTSSDESKTFSQIYSEIYEESRARQMKAEQIYRMYTNSEPNQREHILRSKSRERTAHWVENLGELRKPDESTTDASIESDKESECRQSSGNDKYFTKEDYRKLMQEQLDMINSYQQELRSGYEDCFHKKYANDTTESASDEQHGSIKSQSSHSEVKDSFREQNNLKSESHAELRSEISENSDNPRSESLQNCSKLTENEADASKVLQFEHCEIYIRSSEPVQKTSIEADYTGHTKMRSNLKKTEKCVEIKQTDNFNRYTDGSRSSCLKSSPERKIQKSDSKANDVYDKQLIENSSVDYSKTDDEHSSVESQIWESNEANSSRYSLEFVSQRSEFNENSDQISKFKSNTSIDSLYRNNENNRASSTLGAIEEQRIRRAAYKRESDRIKQVLEKCTAYWRGEDVEPDADSSQKELNNSTNNSPKEEEEQNTQSYENIENSKWEIPRIEGRKVSTPKTRNIFYTGDQNEAECSEPFELRKSRRCTYRINKSENASNNSLKSHHSPTNSTCPTERSTKKVMRTYSEEANDSFLAYDNDSGDDYYLSSKTMSVSTSQINSTLSMRNVSKTYRDRASSPIQVIYCDQSDNGRAGKSKSLASMKSELSKKRSQTSIDSEEKGVQYPSDDELDESAKKSRVSPKICNLDEGLPKVPESAMATDNEDELLDKGQIKEAWKDKNTELSSNNSSCHSLPTGKSTNSSSTNNSSGYSMSNYVPSERFYRRTEPEEDVVVDLTPNDNDPPAVTYRKHVARLAEHVLRTCTNFYRECVEASPELKEDIATKVGMIYNSETQFNTQQRLDKREDLLHQFNEQLHHQLKLISPNLE